MGVSNYRQEVVQSQSSVEQSQILQTASVFIDHSESGLHSDYEEWLE